MNFIGKATIAALVSVGVAAAPAQAASFVDGSGTPYASGTSVTAVGALDVSLFGIFGRKICTVSIDGEVLASGNVEFQRSTPGFISTCNASSDGEVQFPFEVVPTSSSVVTGLNVYFDTPAGLCGTASLPFGWSNTNSKGTLAADESAFPCVMHAGSYLTVTTPAGARVL